MQLYLFDRTEKIIHFDDLGILNGKDEIKNTAMASMSQNEIFVFQIAVVSYCDDVIEKIETQGNIEVSCINTDVVDKFGKRKTQCVNLKKNIIQPLFFTVKADKNGERLEICKITISSSKERRSFDMLFNISSELVENNGYNDLWSLSRISWLNSDLCADETVVKPYISPSIEDDRLTVLGREIQLGKSRAVPMKKSKCFATRQCAVIAVLQKASVACLICRKQLLAVMIFVKFASIAPVNNS